MGDAGVSRRDEEGELPTLVLKRHQKNPGFRRGKLTQDCLEQEFEAIWPSGPDASAFLAKIAVETVALNDQGHSSMFSSRFDRLRWCALSHGTDPFIPIWLGISQERRSSLSLIGGPSVHGAAGVHVRFPGFAGAIAFDEPDSSGKSRDLTRPEGLGMKYIEQPEYQRRARFRLSLTPATELARAGFREVHSDQLATTGPDDAKS